jgi:hypothetical protein
VSGHCCDLLPEVSQKLSGCLLDEVCEAEESDGSACRYIALMENRVTCGKRIIMKEGAGSKKVMAMPTYHE